MPPEIWKAFLEMLIKSPPAVAVLALSYFLGYGLSFLIFDYRKSEARKSHRFMHVVIGLAYAAVIFAACNFDIISKDITLDQIAKRATFTILVGFVVFFFLSLATLVVRERAKPYAGRR